MDILHNGGQKNLSNKSRLVFDIVGSNLNGWYISKCLNVTEKISAKTKIPKLNFILEDLRY